MKIGYLLDTHGGPYNMPLPSSGQVMNFIDHLWREAEAAEQAGFDSLLVPERHTRTECLFPSPLLLLAGLATRTARIRLGTYILILPLYDPVHIAEQMAMLDLMSKGRLICGLASGYHPDYHNAFAIPMKGGRRRFEEALEIVKLAWMRETFSFHGQVFNYTNVRITPKPLQQPCPELWLGGMFPYTIQRAGRSGDAWCSDPFPLQKETWKRQVAMYREAAAKAGNRSLVVLMRDGWVAPTRAEAEQIFGEIYAQELLFYHRYGILTHHPDFRSAADFTVKNCFRHAVAGSPQECIDQLAMYEQEYDVDYVVMRFRLPGGPEPAHVPDCIRLFGEEVLPRVHGHS
jgi:alkanesulfonate monooxygenase SsuD/methylene tetrahydromethanopterin reductase-like flavin-dependent oxidoreductase (luciferase family)